MVKKKLIAMALCAAMSTSICVPASATELPGTTEISVEDSTELATTESQVVEENPTTSVELETEAETTEAVTEETTAEQMEEESQKEDSEQVGETGESDFEWNGTTITKYTGTAAEVTIPEKCTAIGNEAFLENDSIITVNVGNNVEKIGEGCFADCKELETVNISDNVTWMGDRVFQGCESLTTVNIPTNLEYLPSYLFEDCVSLKQVVIPDSVTSFVDPYDECATAVFSGCKRLERVNIPDGVTILGPDFFSNCESLKEINLPDSIQEIYGFAFRGCKQLVKVNIPQGVKWLGDNMFFDCKALTDITIPDSITTIGDYAFYGCGSLKSITIPEGVTRIGTKAFYYCESLTEMNIPKGITSIEDNTFEGCKALKTVTLPQGLTSIQRSAFSDCEALTNIKIPEGVTEIGASAFSNCKALTTIVIPKGVTEIAANMFSGCGLLKEVAIPEEVTVIGASAFSGCESLADIKIPEGVTEIGASAFSECKALTVIAIPDSVTKMGYDEFDRLMGHIFYDCTSLKEVTIGKGITEIVPSMFSGCSSLADITIPEGVTKIGSGAFFCCVSLKNPTIPEGVTEIGDLAFGMCDSITRLTIPKNVAKIDGRLWDQFNINTIAYLYEDSYAHDWVKSQSNMRYMLIGMKSTPVQNLKASPYGAGSVMLTWSKVSGADGYLIYSKKNGKLELRDNSSDTYYEDWKALTAGNNYYWVYPYKNDGNAKNIIGECQKSVYAKGVCPPVTNLKAQPAGKNKVKLTWDEPEGYNKYIDGYIIYAKKNSGKAAYIGMTSKRSYTDIKALDNAYNYYFVYPYQLDSNGKRVLGQSVKYVYAKGVCLAVTNLKATSVKGGVKVTWTKSAGADGYLIYGKRGKNGKYGYIGVKTSNGATTFTDTKAKKDIYSFYWVFPYHYDKNGKRVVGPICAKYVYGKAK